MAKGLLGHSSRYSIPQKGSQESRKHSEPALVIQCCEMESKGWLFSTHFFSFYIVQDSHQGKKSTHSGYICNYLMIIFQFGTLFMIVKLFVCTFLSYFNCFFFPLLLVYFLYMNSIAVNISYKYKKSWYLSGNWSHSTTYSSFEL